MIANVTGLTLDSIVRYSGYVTYTLSFIKPVAFLGGYELKYSFDNALYTYGIFRPDYNLQAYGRSATVDFTKDINGRTIFEFSLMSADTIPGSKLYLKILCQSIYGEYSYDIPSIVSYTQPSVPAVIVDNMQLLVDYQYNKVNLSFLDLDYSSGKNKDLQSIDIGKILVEEIPITDFTNYIIYSNEIFIGDHIVIHDYVKKSIWYGVAYVNGSISLSGFLLADYSHVYTVDSPPFRYNLRAYKSTDIEINLYSETPSHVSSTNIKYTDTVVIKDSMVIYRIKYTMPDSTIYTSIATPIFMQDINSLTPMWRSLEKSNTPMLSNVTWKKIKSTLVDSNYYDKNYWTLPYSENEKYSLIGFCGISDCFVDIYLNNTLYTTLTSTQYGEFEFLYKYPKSTSYIIVQVRTKDNLYTSIQSSELTINTSYVYTFFSTISGEHNLIRQNQVFNNNKINIDSCDSSSFLDIFSPMVGFNQYASENITSYKQFVKGVYKVYNNIAYNQGMFDLMNLFKSTITSIDNIVFLNNAQFEEVQITDVNFLLCKYNDIHLARKKYRYYITAVKFETNMQKQETSPTIIDVDCRWWPLDHFKGHVALSWERSTYATKYYIYRGEFGVNSKIEETSITKLIETEYPYFVDIGEPTDGLTIAPLFNSTIMLPPATITNYSFLTVNSYKNLLKKPYYFNILINMVDDSILPDYLNQRFLTVLKNITPSEMFYHVIISNNSSVSVYNKSGIKVN
jgi:hypothetical protein